MGGHDAGEVEVAGMALSPAAGESPRLVELARRHPPERLSSLPALFRKRREAHGLATEVDHDRDEVIERAKKVCV